MLLNTSSTALTYYYQILQKCNAITRHRQCSSYRKI